MIRFCFLYFVSIFLVSCDAKPENFESLAATQNHRPSTEKSIYHFKTKDKFFEKYDFSSLRKYDNDSVFTDFGIICANDTSANCALKFMQQNLDWKIWNGSSWIPFYSVGDTALHAVELPNIGKVIIPVKSMEVYGKKWPAFMCREEGIDFTTDNSVYLFSSADGIVMLKNPSTIYKRDDIKE